MIILRGKQKKNGEKKLFWNKEYIRDVTTKPMIGSCWNLGLNLLEQTFLTRQTRQPQQTSGTFLATSAAGHFLDNSKAFLIPTLHSRRNASSESYPLLTFQAQPMEPRFPSMCCCKLGFMIKLIMDQPTQAMSTLFSVLLKVEPHLVSQKHGIYKT